MNLNIFNDILKIIDYYIKINNVPVKSIVPKKKKQSLKIIANESLITCHKHGGHLFRKYSFNIKGKKGRNLKSC